MSKKLKKNKGHKKKGMYLARICGNGRDPDRTGAIYINYSPALKEVKKQKQKNIPSKLRLDMCNDSGIFFGVTKPLKRDWYVGMPQGTEGNIVVVGGNGSGKSAGVAIPTLGTWRQAICATDIKGELSKWYEDLFQKGIVTRPYIIFDPTQTDSPSYDPFWWLLQDNEDNLINNIWEIAFAIISNPPKDDQPFWIESERAIFAAALLHYFNLGLSFSQSICKIVGSTVPSLCEELEENGNIQVRMLLGKADALKPETLTSIDRGLRNKLIFFATDPYINHVFRGVREGAECFTWDDLDAYNIFLRIPAGRIEQWSGTINLMYTQLIRYLERRPERYTEQGKHNTQTLLLLDEFARFGKLEVITAAMSTLRSKNVNICLMIQSVAQLDRIYGEWERRIIFDNCQYQIILRANDAETQKYLCELIGTQTRRQHSVSEHTDMLLESTGYSAQIGETRDWIVHPHELSTLNDVLLLTPFGFYRVKKPQLYSATHVIVSAFKERQALLKLIFACEESHMLQPPNSLKKNGDAKMKTIEERIQEADKRIDESKHQQRVAQRQARDDQQKKEKQRNYIIGELVCKYFPEFYAFEPGTKSENMSRFEPVEMFIAELAADKQLVEQMKEKVRCKLK